MYPKVVFMIYLLIYLHFRNKKNAIAYKFTVNWFYNEYLIQNFLSWKGKEVHKFDIVRKCTLNNKMVFNYCREYFLEYINKNK